MSEIAKVALKAALEEAPVAGKAAVALIDEVVAAGGRLLGKTGKAVPAELDMSSSVARGLSDGTVKGAHQSDGVRVGATDSRSAIDREWDLHHDQMVSGFRSLNGAVGGLEKATEARRTAELVQSLASLRETGGDLRAGARVDTVNISTDRLNAHQNGLLDTLRADSRHETAVMQLIDSYNPKAQVAADKAARELGQPLNGEHRRALREAVEDTVLGFRQTLKLDPEMQGMSGDELRRALSAQVTSELRTTRKGLVDTASGGDMISYKGLLPELDNVAKKRGLFLESTPETDAVARSTATMLDRALGSLKSPQETALRRVFFNDMTRAEAARLAEKSPSTVRESVDKGLRAMRYHLRGEAL